MFVSKERSGRDCNESRDLSAQDSSLLSGESESESEFVGTACTLYVPGKSRVVLDASKSWGKGGKWMGTWGKMGDIQSARFALPPHCTTTLPDSRLPSNLQTTCSTLCGYSNAEENTGGLIQVQLKLKLKNS